MFNEDLMAQLRKELDRAEEMEDELSLETKVEEDQLKIHEPMSKKLIEIIE